MSNICRPLSNDVFHVFFVRFSFVGVSLERPDVRGQSSRWPWSSGRLLSGARSIVEHCLVCWCMWFHEQTSSSIVFARQLSCCETADRISERSLALSVATPFSYEVFSPEIEPSSASFFRHLRRSPLHPSHRFAPKHVAKEPASKKQRQFKFWWRICLHWPRRPQTLVGSKRQLIWTLERKHHMKCGHGWESIHIVRFGQLVNTWELFAIWKEMMACRLLPQLNKSRFSLDQRKAIVLPCEIIARKARLRLQTFRRCQIPTNSDERTHLFQV